MCILSVYRPGVPVSVEELTRGASANSDGHGYAIIVDGEIIVNHSLDDPRGLIAEFAAIRAEHPEAHAIFHSRITTHGNTSLDNCHPFFVSGDSRTVLAHNGVLPALVQPGQGDSRSDTRILAEDVFMKRWGRTLDKGKTRKHFTKWIGTYNKVVILTTDPRFDQPLYLFNEPAGVTTAEGVWHSNSTFRGYGRSYCGTGWTWTQSTGTGGYGRGYYEHGTQSGAYVWDSETEEWEYEPRRSDDSRYQAWWEELADDDEPTTVIPVRSSTVGLSGKYAKTVCPSCLEVGGVSRMDLICEHCHQCFTCYEDIRDCACSYKVTSAVRQRLAALDDAAANLSIEQMIKAREVIREFTDDLAYEDYCDRTGTDNGFTRTGTDILTSGTFRAALESVRSTLALPAAPVVTDREAA